MLWFRKKTYPDFYKAYLDLIRKGPSGDLLAMDCETDSHDRKKANIISYGSIRISKGQILLGSQVEWFFKNNRPNRENIAVHELLPEASANDIADYLPVILSNIGNHTLLGHFVEFDVTVINRALYAVGAGPLKNKMVDTLQLALKHDRVSDFRFAKKGDYTLYNLCQRFGIEVTNTHQALDDAYLSALVYLHLQNDQNKK
jgi:DNA polymerase-3 subunit epsilon